MTNEFDKKEWYRALRWLKIAMFSTVLGYFATACILEKIPLENRRCGPRGECLEGYSCVNGTCVKGGGTEQTPTEVKTEDKTEVPPDTPKEVPLDAPKEQPTPDDGGVSPDTPVDTKPDTGPPPGPNCDLFTKQKQEASCTKQTGFACYKIEKDQAFAESPKELPVALAGAVAATNGDNTKTVRTDKPRVFIWVIGGGTKGAPGTDVYFTEIDRDGNILGWTKTESLTTARANAIAFLEDGYLVVAGGEEAGQTPVKVVERAKIKDDGTLEAFKKVGDLSTLRKGGGVTYQHGYFYVAGGNDGGSAVKTVERVPLLSDGTLGSVRALPSVMQLPEGKEGKLVSNHYSLYFASSTDSKIYLGPLQGDSNLRGWCETTPMPSDVKKAQVLLNARILILYGIEKTSNSLDGRVFIAALNAGSGTPRGGGIRLWVCSDADAAKAVLTRPRKQAAAAIARGFLFVIGGVDSGDTTLKSVEKVFLPFQDSQCDLDADGLTNFVDKCSNVYNPKQKQLCDTKMRLVPAGSFQRGDGGADTPSKSIDMDAFYMDATEITNAQYKACVDDGDCTEPKKDPVAGITDYYTNDKYKDFPVVHVTWKQALAYCQSVGKRLPTEAEWEKAARGITRFKYPWGDDSPTCKRANIGSCPTPLPVAVSQFPPGRSPYGIDDLAGNVREWVSDFFDKEYFKTSKETNNPKGPTTGSNRAIKSSSFKSGGSPDAFKTSARGSAKEDFSAEDLGFRCAVSVFPTAP